jgi:uncharacterized protein (TIGR03435 family)
MRRRRSEFRRTWRAMLCLVSLAPWTVAAAQSATPANAPAPQASQPSAAQSPDAPLPSFEVASVKKHVDQQGGGLMARMIMGPPPGDTSHWMASGVTVKMLIATAYSVKPFQIGGGPGWLDSVRWDIDAKVEDALATQLQKLPRQRQQAQEALMLRSLLADRFKLQVTHAAKEGNVLALVIGKGGPKLKEVQPLDPNAPPPPPPVHGNRGELPQPAPGQSFMMMNPRQATLIANAVPIASLVNQLSMQLGQQVVDKTGLKGMYQYTLQFAPQSGVLAGLPPKPGDAGPNTVEPDSEEPSLFTALQDQLGLKLESTKGPIETITIDHIEEPSEN